MLRSRRLVLHKETLTELTSSELRGVAGGDDSLGCLKTLRTCATCVDTLTVATCQCPAVTGATCACPTDYGCA